MNSYRVPDKVRMGARLTLAAALMATFSHVDAANAQTPGPNHHFVAVAPGHRTLTPAGVVVEALGIDGCDSRRVPARNDVVYYINHSEPVWLEISPQSVCESVSSYESHISDVLGYIDANTSDSDEGAYFDGVMLDEEDGFGFSVTSLANLNHSVEQDVTGTPGNTWWSLEGFVASGSNANGCDWTYSQYDSVLSGNGLSQGTQAEQIEHQCNINLVNHDSSRQAAVTWYSGYTPGNTEANASGPVNAPCYVDSALSYRWSNEFLPT